MNDDTTGTTSKTDPKTDWRRLRSMTDEEIHAAIIEDPDAKATDEGFWKEAPRGHAAAERNRDDAAGRGSSRMVPPQARLPNADQRDLARVYERPNQSSVTVTRRESGGRVGRSKEWPSVGCAAQLRCCHWRGSRLLWKQAITRTVPATDGTLSAVVGARP